MNRNYKVIWNASLNCFMAVAEYAKARGKSSSGTVTSNASPTSSVVGGAKWLRLSSLCLGMAAAGFSLQAIAVAPATGAFYVGVNSTANGANYNGEGATGWNAMAMGQNSIATGTQAISIGSSSGGQKTTASGEQSIAIGANVVSNGASSIAIGGDDLEEASKANLNSSPALDISNSGSVNTAFKYYAGRDLVEAGNYIRNTEAGGAASIAIGTKSLSTGALSTAVGVQSTTEGVAASAFGMAASASKDGSVALGAGSTTLTNATFQKKLTIGNKNYYYAGATKDPGAQVSVGSVGKERQIKHVAAGAINKDSTDAVNGSQLHATNQSIENLSTGITTKGLDFAGNDGVKIHKDLGHKLEIVGTLADSKTASAKNIRTVAKNGKLEIQLADDLDVTSVTTGNSLLNNAGLQVGNNVFITNQGLQAGNTRITDGGLTFTGSTVAVTAGGINAGGKKITNVDDGVVAVGSKDAINGGQLQEVKNAAANANKGWDISAAGGTATNVAPGTVVDFNSKDTNITVSKNVTSDETSVSFELNRDLSLDSATFGDVKLSTTGLDNGGKTITNVADGVIGVNSKDAINGGQLDQVVAAMENSTSVLAEQMDAGLNFSADTGAVINKKLGDNALSFKGGNNITTTAEGSSIKFDLNGNINVESVTTGNTTVNNSGVTIKNGPSMTAAGIYAGNAETAPSMTAAGINAAGTKVTNVADGMAPRDAVNFGQLDAVSRNLNNNINELGYKIGEVEDDANAGISAAMAMSSLPQAYIIGKSMIGGGIAAYNGESAVAIGFSKLSDDGRWVMKLNGTADTQGNVGAAIGAGFHFD
ncbi:YadA-like family protein [Psychrobacter sp. ANT_WB68]|uniref:YadA-like family protein n=1 Tax=Psychrobacter sp. ANT_WB68 TaxID=2597355 RepID=UPI0011F283F4|nr:YadA-like family protein [Psychrobacter sp. ANT_WB68]KAA0914476.1 hypothetical protein FQ084_07870 [Psychrobacter sp. ANT_WB68]